MKYERGFTLVELSIVLVILGLLVGGVLTGQSLIRAAELRSISTDYQRYQTAVQTFRDKYFAIPGDMPNATSYWGVLAGDGFNNCQTTPATGAATCNGDGDGSFLDVVGGVTNSTWEGYRFWQHLANAGLIEGQYTGLTNYPPTVGSNVPRSKINNSFFLGSPGKGYTTEGGSTYYAGTTARFAGDQGKNTMVFTSSTGVDTTAGSYSLNPSEALNVDTKLDDGLPSSGSIWGIKGNGTNTNCTTFAGIAPPGDAGATYLLSNNNKDCALYFVRAF